MKMFLKFMFYFIVSFFITLSVHATIAPAQDWSFLEPIVKFMVELLGEKAAKVMGILYFVSLMFKPLFTLLQAYTNATHWTVKDDQLLTKVMTSKIYLALVYIFDLLLRIKLPKAKTELK